MDASEIEKFDFAMPSGKSPKRREAAKRFVEGAKFAPFDLAGLPVDLVNLALQGFGAATGQKVASDKPFLGSEYLIDKYADVVEALGGSYQRPQNDVDELMGRIIGGAATDPAIVSLLAGKAPAQAAKGIGSLETATAADPDLTRRKVVAGIAALPVAGTSLGKVVADAPVAAKAVAKTLPKVTGSKLLDSLPFVRDELAPIFKNVLTTEIDYLAPYDSTPSTPGGIPKPRPTKQVEIPPEKRLFQGIFQLNQLKDRIRYFGGSENTKTLSDIGDTQVGDRYYEIIEGGEESLGVTDNILKDFAEKYPNMSLDDAIKMIDKEGYDMFVEAYKKGDLDNSEFVNFVADVLHEGNRVLGKEHIEKVIKDNPNGTIDTIVYDIFESDNIYDFMDPDSSLADDIGREFFETLEAPDLYDLEDIVG